ncbi:MAG TPA: zf-HC2 domain-containing protein [Candidatus Limnocylindria bacterium]|nr:zf-HC2 domain-containing protein [Candidatus Limnocylindria bacterium]
MTAARRELTCREATDFLAAYVGGELRAAQRRAFESHLAECPDCRTYLQQYELTRRLAREASDHAGEADIPGELVAAILAARAVVPDDE